MAELVDALASGASVRKDMGVRVSLWAPCILQPNYYRAKYRIETLAKTVEFFAFSVSNEAHKNSA